MHHPASQGSDKSTTGRFFATVNTDRDAIHSSLSDRKNDQIMGIW